MRNLSVLQERLFSQIKRQLDPNIHLVDELESILQISSDSAYRRLRGSTLLNINELQTLCEHFDISMDQILDGSSSRITFTFQPIKENAFTFSDYLVYIMNMMKHIEKSTNKELFYLSNDIPFFHLLNAPEIASFKLFFWQRTILGFSSYRNRKFKLNEKNEQINSISRTIRDAYFNIPSVEIYSPETVDITIRQVLYYFEAGKFEDPKDALVLCDKLEALLEHLQIQCEAATKFKIGEPINEISHGQGCKYQVYFNEVLFTDASILVRTDSEKITYLTNNGLNVLSTKEDSFFDENLDTFRLLAKKSTLISGDSEKARSIVFNDFRKKVDQLRTKIMHELTLV